MKREKWSLLTEMVFHFTQFRFTGPGRTKIKKFEIGARDLANEGRKVVRVVKVVRWCAAAAAPADGYVQTHVFFLSYCIQFQCTFQQLHLVDDFQERNMTSMYVVNVQKCNGSPIITTAAAPTGIKPRCFSVIQVLLLSNQSKK